MLTVAENSMKSIKNAVALFSVYFERQSADAWQNIDRLNSTQHMFAFGP